MSSRFASRVSVRSRVLRLPLARALFRSMQGQNYIDYMGTGHALEASRWIPKLRPDNYKGQQGKIVVVGGCEEYTGAPYFAAYAGLKMGADLAHVFCTDGAAPVIKGYSPELIVHPYLSEKSATSTVMKKFEPWFQKFKSPGSCVVIGPGLGRNPKVLDQAKQILFEFNKRGVPVVLDADALWMLSEEPGMLEQLDIRRLVLTPNKVEAERLVNAGLFDPNVPPERRADPLLKATLVLKGMTDSVHFPDIEGGMGGIIHVIDQPGSARRVGGQGDVLTGSIATFIAWNLGQEPSSPSSTCPSSDILHCMASAGCVVTRMASYLAFQKHHRGMGAPDLIAELKDIVVDLESVREQHYEK